MCIVCKVIAVIGVFFIRGFVDSGLRLLVHDTHKEMKSYFRFCAVPMWLTRTKTLLIPFQWRLPLIDFTTHPELTLRSVASVSARCDNDRSANS